MITLHSKKKKNQNIFNKVELESVTICKMAEHASGLPSFVLLPNQQANSTNILHEVKDTSVMTCSTVTF